VILDNSSSGTVRNLKKTASSTKIIKGDIRDVKLVAKLVSESDEVYHLAASLGVENIMNHTQESVSVNFIGSENVLNACLKYDKRVIIASTSEVYGKNPKQPLSETDDRVVGSPQKIRWTYSDAKALEEAIAYSMHINNNLKVTTARFFNTVGPRQTGRYGMVLPRFVSSALNGEPIRVFGSGEQTRVFCHVNDAVRAIEILMSTDSSVGEVYNIGGIREVSINELATMVVRKTNSKSTIKHIPYTEAYPEGYEDMLRRVPNTEKIKREFNWTPKLTLEEIIEDVIKGFRDDLKLV
jgi:UDP-glucose 4-epimerase